MGIYIYKVKYVRQLLIVEKNKLSMCIDGEVLHGFHVFIEFTLQCMTNK